MSSYAATAANAAKKIASAGKPATLSRVSHTETGWKKYYDTSTKSDYWKDELGNRVDSDPTITATETCYVLEEAVERRNTDGTLVEHNTRRFLCTATPELNDLITVDGETLTVVLANPFRPGDTTIYTVVEARQ